MTNAISNRTLFHRLDLDSNMNLQVEEIYTVRLVYEARLNILKFVQLLKHNIGVKEVVDELLVAISSVDKREAQHPAQATPIIKPPSSNSLQEFLPYKVLSDYVLLSSDLREHYKAELKSFVAEMDGISDFSKTIREYQEFLNKAPMVSGNFPRMEICDGEAGVSLDEYSYFESLLFEGNQGVPYQLNLNSFKYDIQLAKSHVSTLKNNVRIVNPEMKRMVYFVLDRIAESPTGAVLLKALMDKTGDKGIQFGLLTQQDYNKLQGADAMCVYLNDKNMIGVSSRVFQTPPPRKMPDEILARFADNIGHEIFHSVIHQPGHMPTIAEEVMAHKIGGLITRELGLGLSRSQTRTMLSNEAQEAFIWNTYSLYYYATSDQEDVQNRESAFQQPQWNNYIDQQTERIFEMGLESCGFKSCCF